MNRDAGLQVPPTPLECGYEKTHCDYRHIAGFGAGHVRVVNLSSGAGIRGYAEIARYCAAKHGVEGLSKAVANELPEGMAVIPVQPGVIHTDKLDLHFGERAAEFDSPHQWVERAGPFFLRLGPGQNGESLRIPDSD